MKCPKCGYVSFDHLDRCKKCDQDLADHKTRFGLGALFTRRKAPAPSPASEEPLSGKNDEPGGFGFDFDDSSSDGERTEAGSGLDPEIRRDSDPSRGESTALQTSPDSREPIQRGPWKTDLSDPAQFPSSGEKKVDVSGGELPELPRHEAPGEPSLSTDDLPPLPPSPGISDGTLDQALEVEGEESFDFSLEWDEDENPAPSPELPTEKREKAPSEPSSAEADRKGDPSDPFEPGGAARLRSPAVSRPSRSSLFSEARPPDIPNPASVSALFAAGLIDLALLGTAFFLFLLAGNQVLGKNQGFFTWPSLPFLMRTAMPFFLVLFFLFFGYFTLLHSFGGQTLGKIFFKLRVEDLSGRPMTFSQAVIRSAGGLISWLCLGVGFLVPVFFRGSRSWNDRLAGTRVVAADFSIENPSAVEEQLPARISAPDA